MLGTAAAGGTAGWWGWSSHLEKSHLIRNSIRVSFDYHEMNDVLGKRERGIN